MPTDSGLVSDLFALKPLLGVSFQRAFPFSLQSLVFCFSRRRWLNRASAERKPCSAFNLTTWSELLKVWLALTSVNYHRNIYENREDSKPRSYLFKALTRAYFKSHTTKTKHFDCTV